MTNATTTTDSVPAPPQPSAPALTSLVLGVASFVLPLVASLPALFVGYRALYAINASEGRLSGRRLAIAGIVLGGLTTAIAVVGFIVIIFVNLAQKSRYVDCQDHLRRIGIGVYVYHDNTPEKSFPLATIPNAELPVNDRLSWHAGILPYLDYALPQNRKWLDVSGAIEHNRSWDDLENAVAANTTIPVFLCPNHPTYDPAVRPAPAHYVGCAGLGADAASLPKRDERAGFFGYARVLHRDDLPDGYSYTLMALETTFENGPWIAAGFPTARGVPEVDHLFGLGAPFGGCHSGGLNALFADGSVKFQSDTIEPKVFQNQARLSRD
jgi:prepilin-type processing-associated H-X9-DG protein